MKITYVLRKVADFDYNSFADLGIWDFTNGIVASMRCSRHDDEKFPRGTTVCCIQTGDAEHEKLVTMMEVKSISPDGKITFGETIGYLPRLPPPGRSDIIIDERVDLEGRVFGATQIEMPNELPKLPDPREDKE